MQSSGAQPGNFRAYSRVDAIGDICEVPVRSLGIFEHTGCGEPHG